MKWEDHTPEEQEEILRSINKFILTKEESEDMLDNLKKSREDRNIGRDKADNSMGEYGDFIKQATKQNCLHESCPECHGTGKKDNGTQCIHYISCPCPKCSPQYL